MSRLMFVCFWVFGSITLTTVLTILERRGIDLWNFTGGVYVGAMLVLLAVLPFAIRSQRRRLAENERSRRDALLRSFDR